MNLVINSPLACVQGMRATYCLVERPCYPLPKHISPDSTISAPFPKVKCLCFRVIEVGKAAYELKVAL